MHRLGHALSEVSTAAEDEARRRTTEDTAERTTRLQILASQVLENGDPDEIAAFAREVLASVEKCQGHDRDVSPTQFYRGKPRAEGHQPSRNTG